MSTQITRGTTSLTPILVTGYSSTRTSKNIIHNIIGRADPDVTLQPAGLRTGTLEMLVQDLPAALALEALHAEAGVCHLTESDLPGLAMYYVADGSIEVSLDEDTRTLWKVTVGFQEVLP